MSLSSFEDSALSVSNEKIHEILKGDKYNAILEVWDLEEAQRGRLQGLPVLLKDNVCAKGHVVSCGSKYLENHKSLYDAHVTTLLKEAGCRMVGRSNMDEFAMGSSTEHSAFGATLNPWNINCVPGGSSGGSAAAVAAGYVPIALGSDTGGSVRQPAAFCGVVGYKPTYGLLSRRGLVSFASSFDQIGLFSRKVDHLFPVMDVISKKDIHDSTSFELAQDWICESVDFSKLKIGYLPSRYLEGVQGEIASDHQSALEWYESLGATIHEVNLDHFEYGLNVYYIVALAEASANLARYDGIRYGHRSVDISSMQDIYYASREEGLGKEVKRRILLGTHVLSSGYADAYYNHARKVQTKIFNDFKVAFESVDVILTPTTRTTAFEFGAKASPVEMYKSDWYTVCANLAGLPGVSVPTRLDSKNMPIGLQLMAPQRGDIRMLSIASKMQADFSESLDYPS